LKTFICYPSESETIAREAAGFVRSVGIDCWFDKDSLVAGEDWDRSRRLALQDANVVLVLCSAATTGRNGVYQREINEALSLSADRRLGTIHILPLRLEDVPLPPELSRLQYVDYFGPDWRRKVAAGLDRACKEAGETTPDRLMVAAAQPDQGGVIARSKHEERSSGTIEADWIEYALDGEYWDFVNGVIRTKALGGVYEARRQLDEWWQKTGSSWEIHISEFHRKGDLVSLTVGSFNYFAGAAHPNHGVKTINMLGPQAGIMSAYDLFDGNADALAFLTDYVNLDLRRQSAETSEVFNISYYAETYGWELYDQYCFNEAGMQINLSSMSGLPHALGYFDTYLPWQSVKQFLAPVARRVLLGAEI
jgi:hypothetical protein